MREERDDAALCCGVRRRVRHCLCAYIIARIVFAPVALSASGMGRIFRLARSPARSVWRRRLPYLMMLVIISVATDKLANGAVPGLAIGLTVVLDALIGGPVSGGSMNSVRSLGPTLFVGRAALSVYWLYVVGPCLGAAAAVWFYEAIRGGNEHAQNAPNDLASTLHEIEKNAHTLL